MDDWIMNGGIWSGRGKEGMKGKRGRGKDEWKSEIQFGMTKKKRKMN